MADEKKVLDTEENAKAALLNCLSNGETLATGNLKTKLKEKHTCSDALFASALTALCEEGLLWKEQKGNASYYLSKEALYNQSVKNFSTVKKPDLLDELLASFFKLGDYENSKEYITKCEEKISALLNERISSVSTIYGITNVETDIEKLKYLSSKKELLTLCRDKKCALENEADDRRKEKENEAKYTSFVLAKQKIDSGNKLGIAKLESLAKEAATLSSYKDSKDFQDFFQSEANQRIDLLKTAILEVFRRHGEPISLDKIKSGVRKNGNFTQSDAEHYVSNLIKELVKKRIVKERYNAYESEGTKYAQSKEKIREVNSVKGLSSIKSHIEELKNKQDKEELFALYNEKVVCLKTPKYESALNQLKNVNENNVVALRTVRAEFYVLGDFKDSQKYVEELNQKIVCLEKKEKRKKIVKGIFVFIVILAISIFLFIGCTDGWFSGNDKHDSSYGYGSGSGYGSSYDSGYDYDKGYGYEAPKPGQSFSDYVKEQDPDLYNSMLDRYNSLT